MLQEHQVIAFVPTTDPDRARSFYERQLGLRFVADDGFALVFDLGGTTLRIARISGAFEPPGYTVLGWQVDDIEAVARELRERGIEFLRFDGFEQDDLGIWTSPNRAGVAWFKDPDGNTLSISAHRG